MQKSSSRWRDSLAITLLTIVVFTASARLVLTEWTPDLYIIERITISGLLLGIALGYSTFKKNNVILLTFLYSLFLVPWQIIIIFDSEFFAIERLSQLSKRLNLTRQLFIAKEAVEDPLIFIVLILLLFWSIAIYAGYALLRKQNSLAALLPSTLTILAIQYYDHRGESALWMLGFYFFFSLLFLGRIDHKENTTRWRKEKVFVIPDAKLDINIITTASLAVLLLVAWNIPSTRAEWTTLSRWWQKTSHRFNTTREDIENLFSAVDNPRPVASGSAFYGTELSLGQRSYQGEEEVIIVHAPKLENPPPRFYWRVRSYDTYLNGSWASSPEEIYQDFNAQTALPLPYFEKSTLAEFTFTNQVDGRRNLITGQQPILADIDVEALYIGLPDNTLDLNLLRAKEELRDEEKYTLRSALIAPTAKEMREAGTEYPDWVTERYLQLPSNLPESIEALAVQLTTGRTTPYDKVRAITNYLRSEITYNTEVPAPPQGRDALEWFLFTWKEGYCNYSASAEVVLLRSAGVPARLVVGFAQGKRNEIGNFVVLRKDAHAWAEVYFPKIGWVEFEPTLNQPRLLRPSGDVDAEEEDMLDLRKLLNDEKAENILPPEEEDLLLPEVVENNPKVDIEKRLFWSMTLLLTVGISFGLWYFNREQVYVTRALRFVIRFYEKNNLTVPTWFLRWMRWRETNPIARAFYSINTNLRLLEEEVPPHFTPQERASALINLLPQCEKEINILLAEHQKALFSPNDGDLKIAQHASRIIRRHVIKEKIIVRKRL